MSSNTLYLVDGSSYLYRAFHVPNLQRLKTADGRMTGVIFGVYNMIQRLLDEHRPEHMAVVFDAKGKTFRHDMYAEYKATRPPMPEELAAQLAPTKAIVRALGIELIEAPGVEADDVIGTLAREAERLGMHTLISTGDKDLAQLVSDRITLVDTMRNSELDRAGVREKFGVTPEQIVDYLALVGDTSDNIPGVNKVGPKTAAKWLCDYQDIEGLVAHADEIKGKVGEYLREGLEQLHLSRQLATVKTDLELAQHADGLALGAMDTETLHALGEEFQIKRLQQLKAADRPAPVERPEYTVIQDRDTLDEWLKAIADAGIVSLDLETTSLDPLRAEVVGVAMAHAPGRAAYVPIAHQGVEGQLPLDDVLSALMPVLKKVTLVGQHFKYDLNVLSRGRHVPDRLDFDTMLESYVLNSTATRHDMDSLAEVYLQKQTIKYEEVCGKGAKQIGFDEVPLAQAAQYAAEDADITLQLHQTLWPKLQKLPGQQRIFTEVEMPLALILARMEQTGVLIDPDNLQRQSAQLGEEMQDIQARAWAQAGEEFNLNSPSQLSEILFTKQQLPVLKKTPTGQPSTAEEVLQDLAVDHALPALVLRHRSLSKLKSTYTDKLPLEINPDTGRVHTSYHQAVAATGRLSSSNPNLQNIPIRTAEGRAIRQAFVAPAGWCILAADYSQIELRLMAHMSQDAGMLQAFSEGVDIHSQTASQVFSVSLDAVDAEHRRAAKAINFGLMYGMSAFGLAKQLGIDRAQAADYIEQYFSRFPGVRDFMEATKQTVRDQGHLDTLYGRRLYFPDINSRNARVRAASERAAINAPLQGTAADIIKMAMIGCDRALGDHRDIRLIMQVHDELVFEVRREAAETMNVQVCELMQNAADLSVPLIVHGGIGDNWDEAH